MTQMLQTSLNIYEWIAGSSSWLRVVIVLYATTTL